jgi:hypothetical protein
VVRCGTKRYNVRQDKQKLWHAGPHSCHRSVQAWAADRAGSVQC